MPRSTLVLYEPLTDHTDKSYYWKEYVEFYERYWGGPTSPFGVWFGNEYESFEKALASHIGVNKEELEHCFFTKDEEGRCYIAPLKSKANLFFSENYIPLEWFIMFDEREKQTLYTHWGFNALHYDTRIRVALERIGSARNVISDAESKAEFQKLDSAHAILNISESADHLRSWLSGFDPSGYIVLNYGDLCSVINPYTLENERSVGELWDAISMLKQCKLDEADSIMNNLIRKWDDIRSYASGEQDESTIQ